MLHQILYSSRARDGLEPADIESILQSARPTNSQAGITGVLIYSDGVFFQLIEGEEALLDPLMRRIVADDRHGDVKVFRREPIFERNFGAWQMAYLAPDAEALAHWAELEGAVTLEELAQHLDQSDHMVPTILTRIVAALRRLPA